MAGRAASEAVIGAALTAAHTGRARLLAQALVDRMDAGDEFGAATLARQFGPDLDAVTAEVWRIEAERAQCASSFCTQPAGPHRINGAGGHCRRCFNRWISNGRPARGPAPPRKSHISGAGTAAGRLEDYQWLRTEQRLGREAAAARLGVTQRTIIRYERRLQQQAA